MKAADTNILVRLIARDDAAQLRAARVVASNDALLVLPTVVLEAEWVLRSRYRMPREEIADGLSTICGQDNVTVLSAYAVAVALARYAEAGDFADHLHVALAAEAGAIAFVTFDRDLSIPDDSAIAVETL